MMASTPPENASDSDSVSSFKVSRWSSIKHEISYVIYDSIGSHFSTFLDTVIDNFEIFSGQRDYEGSSLISIVDRILTPIGRAAYNRTVPPFRRLGFGLRALQSFWIASNDGAHSSQPDIAKCAIGNDQFKGVAGDYCSTCQSTFSDKGNSHLLFCAGGLRHSSKLQLKNQAESGCPLCKELAKEGLDWDLWILDMITSLKVRYIKRMSPFLAKRIYRRFKLEDGESCELRFKALPAISGQCPQSLRALSGRMEYLLGYWYIDDCEIPFFQCKVHFRKCCFKLILPSFL
jgi:hypothetical protein